SKGYAYYGVDFRLQRAMIVFPVFWGMVASLVEKTNTKTEKYHRFLVVIYFLILTTGLYYHYNFQKNNRLKDVLDDFQVINYMNSLILNKQRVDKIYIVGNSNGKFLPLNDSLQYFFPAIRSEFLPDLTNCLIPKNSLVIVFNNHRCYNFLASQQSTKVLAAETQHEFPLEYKLFYNSGETSF
ncbi:MAG: hypothetical protein ACPLY7_02045, partial [Microgenomates group bacterium]